MSKSNYSSAYFYSSIFNENRSVTISFFRIFIYSDVGKIAIEEFDVLNNPNMPYELRLEYSNNGVPSSKGYLDYIEINCTRQLMIDNQQFDFHLNDLGNQNSYSEIILNNASSVDMIWDISNIFDVKNISFQKLGSSLSFKNQIDSLKHFIAISGSNFPYPQFDKEVLNQNLHADNTVDMIIVSPSEFLSAAYDLKSVHELEGLSVMVVKDEEIYNEFSGGIPDATAIKQFLRMFYVRENGNPNTIPKYCLLFGDGSYDNRNILGHNKNTLPIYESFESLSVVNTYATDDYFAILADGASMQNTDFLNIGVGRLVVTNIAEANEMVQKIKNYIFDEDNAMNNLNCNNNLSNSIYRDWRNKVVMVSDDEDNNAYFTDIEIMSNKIKKQINHLLISLKFIQMHILKSQPQLVNEFPMLKQPLIKRFKTVH